MTIKTINIPKDFSPYPAGRFDTDGDFSGQTFRDNFLVPILKNGERATVLFDGARGYGSSFLEEAFGGLVRMGFAPETIKETFTLESSDKSIVDEVTEYINHGGDE